MIDLVALQSLRAVRSLRLGGRGGGGPRLHALGGVPADQEAGAADRVEQMLERYGRGVLLTDHGERLADQGADLLDRMEQIESDLYSAGSVVGGRLRLAAFSTAVRGLVAPALSLVAADGYDLRLSLVELDPPWGWRRSRPARSTRRWSTSGVTRPRPSRARRAGHDRGRRGRHPRAVRSPPRSAVLGDAGGPRRRGVRVGPRRERLPRVADPALRPGRRSAARLVLGGRVELAHRPGEPRRGGVADPAARSGPLPDSVRVLPVRDPVPTRQVSLAWRRSMGSSPTIRYLRDTSSRWRPASACRPEATRIPRLPGHVEK